MSIRLGKCISGKYAKELFDKESLERSREMSDRLSHGHFIMKCRECGTVIMQCRCATKDKEIRLSICDDCAKKTPSLDAIRNEPDAIRGDFGEAAKRERLRDQFAMAALQGSELRLWSGNDPSLLDRIAARAYKVADAMLEARG